MNAQKSIPMNASSPKRAARPRSLAIARARAVSHFGRSSSAIGGSGRRTASGIQDLDQLARRVLASETQEDLLEPFGTRLGTPAKVGHRAARADRSVRDDRDAIAHRFGDFESVRAHHDRVAAA